MTGIPFDEWGTVEQCAARALARNPDTGPLYSRLMFAAQGWSNLIGHAEFEDGELAQVLGSVDRVTGEAMVPSRRQMTNEIRRAERKNLLGVGSTVECLICPPWWTKAGGGGGRTCAAHGIGVARKRHTRCDAATSKRHTECDAKATNVTLSVTPQASDLRKREIPLESDLDALEIGSQCTVAATLPRSSDQGATQTKSGHEEATPEVRVSPEAPALLAHGRVNPHPTDPTGAEPQTPSETQPQRKATPVPKPFETHPKKVGTPATFDRVCSTCQQRKGSTVDESGVCLQCRRIAAASVRAS